MIFFFKMEIKELRNEIQFIRGNLDYLEPVAKNCLKGYQNKDFYFCHVVRFTLSALIQRDSKEGVIKRAEDICKECSFPGQYPRVFYFYEE